MEVVCPPQRGKAHRWPASFSPRTRRAKTDRFWRCTYNEGKGGVTHFLVHRGCPVHTSALDEVLPELIFGVTGSSTLGSFSVSHIMPSTASWSGQANAGPRAHDSSPHGAHVPTPSPKWSTRVTAQPTTQMPAPPGHSRDREEKHGLSILEGWKRGLHRTSVHTQQASAAIHRVPPQDLEASVMHPQRDKGKRASTSK